jgi:transposase-like protein
VQGKELQVSKREQRVRRFPDEFRSAAVQRVKNGEPIADVARDVDVHPQLLRGWVNVADVAACAKVPAAMFSSEVALRRENQQLKQALAEKVLEVDFFKGALQKVEARRRPNGKAGATASTPRSGR